MAKLWGTPGRTRYSIAIIRQWMQMGKPQFRDYDYWYIYVYLHVKTFYLPKELGDANYMRRTASKFWVLGTFADCNLFEIYPWQVCRRQPLWKPDGPGGLHFLRFSFGCAWAWFQKSLAPVWNENLSDKAKFIPELKPIFRMANFWVTLPWPQTHTCTLPCGSEPGTHAKDTDRDK